MQIQREILGNFMQLNISISEIKSKTLIFDLSYNILMKFIEMFHKGKKFLLFCFKNKDERTKKQRPEFGRV